MTIDEFRLLESRHLLPKVKEDFPHLWDELQKIIAIDRYLRSQKVIPFDVAVAERKFRREMVAKVRKKRGDKS